MRWSKSDNGEGVGSGGEVGGAEGTLVVSCEWTTCGGEGDSIGVKG